ncbi:uncharacterized protein LOC136091618 [Hydra vulgaris]|uniref:Uncharacterized protein LOC136091618 n=1 Tax=Hydra vulgaris TaxID=6087 RepID=A0ABM4DLH6_HYDVU
MSRMRTSFLTVILFKKMATIPILNILMSNLSYEYLLFFLRTTNQSDIICRLAFYEAVDGSNGFVISTIDIIVGILIFILNILLVNGVCRLRRKGKSFTHNEKLVLLLSSIDILVASIYMPLEIVLVKMLDQISCIFISIIGFWLVFPLIFSGSIVVLISIERFNTLLNNKKCCGVKFNGFYAATILCFHFLISFGLGVWYALLNYFQSPIRQQSYYFFSVATYTISNLLSVLIMNTLLLIKTKKKLGVKEIRVAQHIVVERRLTQTMMLISTSLMILYLPVAAATYNIFVRLYLNELKSFGNAMKMLFYALIFCQINSLFNAFIYVFRNRNILKFYKRLITLNFKKDVGKHKLAMQLSSKHISTDTSTQKFSESNENVFFLNIKNIEHITYI